MISLTVESKLNLYLVVPVGESLWIVAKLSIATEAIVYVWEYVCVCGFGSVPTSKLPGTQPVVSGNGLSS